MANRKIGEPDPFPQTEGQQRRIDERGHNLLTIDDLKIIKKMREFKPTKWSEGDVGPCPWFRPDPSKRDPK